MTQPLDREQAKRSFLNIAKVIVADGKFTDWMPIMIFLSVPIASGINLYILVDAIYRHIILAILVSLITKITGINDLDGWMIGNRSLGSIIMAILAFVVISFLLFISSKIFRKMV